MTSERAIVLGVAFAGLLLLAAAIVWRLRRRAGGPTAALRTIAIDRMQNLLLPDGIGGLIHIEHLVLTRNGIVVFDVKAYAGTVFGSDRMDEWTVMGPSGRFLFPNPQAALLNRVAAVKELMSSMPVEGYVLFGDDADFTKGKPAHILQVSEVLERYAKPTADECARLASAYAPHWQKLKAAATEHMHRSAA